MEDDYCMVFPVSDYAYALYVQDIKQGVLTLKLRGLNAEALNLKEKERELDELRTRRKKLVAMCKAAGERRKVRIEITRKLLLSTSMQSTQIMEITGISTEEVLKIKAEIDAQN